MALGHLGITVPDLAVAKRYYDALLPLVGYEPFLVAEDEVAYLPADGKRGAYLFFYPAADGAAYTPGQAGLQHLAFMVPTRSAVQDVHRHVLAAGGVVEHAPMEFPHYPPPYFAMFWRDPFGIMLEAVCHYDRQ
ncbi:MAG TPA: VOC family protein [Acidimicrobiales bacterium]|nr:VOC family protein [Acidimicrobiales bacterium]